jgi:hypothetical protein
MDDRGLLLVESMFVGMTAPEGLRRGIGVLGNR